MIGKADYQTAADVSAMFRGFQGYRLNYVYVYIHTYTYMYI